MKRKHWLLGVVLSGCVAGIGFGLQPLSETYVGPYVQEQLHTALNGTVSYSSFHIGWDGSVQMKDLVVNDAKGQPVLTADALTVSIQWLKVLQYPFGQVSPDALLGTITVISPHVNVVQDEQGQWNVLQLVKERESDSPSQFSGLLRLEKGSLSLFLPQAEPLQLSDVNVTVLGDGGHMLDGVVDAQLGKDHIHSKIQWALDDSGNRLFYVETPHLDIAPIVSRISLPNAVSSMTGELTDMALTVTQRGGFWYGEGGLSFQNVGTTLQDYRLTSGKGTLQIHGDVLFLDGIEANVNDEHLRMNGTVHHVFDEDPTLHVNVGLKGWNLASFSQLPLTGTITADALLTGPVSNVKASADVELRDVTYEGITVNRGKGHLSYGDQVIHVEDAELSTQGGAVRGAGSYHMDTEDFSAQLEVQDVSLYGMPLEGLPSVHGTVSGSLTIEGKQGAISNINGSVHGHHIEYQSILVEALDASVSWDGTQLVVPYMNGTWGRGTFTGSGRFGNGIFGINLHGINIGLEQFNEWSSKPLGGTVSLEANLQGSLENPTGTVMIAGETLSYGTTKFDRAFVKTKLEDTILHILEGDLEYRKSTYDLDGFIRLDGEQTIDIKGSAKDVRIEDVLPNFTDIPMTGWLNTDVHVQGTVQRPQIEGHLKAWDGSAYGKLFSSIEGAYTYHNGHLHLPRLDISTYGSSIIVDGDIQDKQLDINFVGDAVPIEPFVRDAGLDIVGYVGAEGHLGGTVDAPIFEGNVQSDTMQVKDTTLHDITGSVYITPQVVHLQGLTFTGSGTSRYEVKGGVQLENPKRLFGYVHVKDGDLHQLLALTNAQVPDVNGKLQATIELGGTSDSPRLDVKGTLEDTTIRDEVVGTATLDLGYGGRTIDIRTFKLPIKEGLIVGKGKADLDGSTDIQLVASKVPVQTVLPLVTKNVNAQGNWNFIINVHGLTKSPKVEFSSEVEQAVINGISLDQLSILGTMEDQVVNIQQGMIKKSDSSIKVRGKIPLGAFVTNEYVTDDMTKQFDVYVDMNEANLSVLPLMFKEVQSADGAIHGVVHVTGNSSNILANGTVELANGSMQLQSLKKPVTQLKGQLLFRGNHVDITGSTTMGKGNAGLSGNIGWMGSGITSYYGALQMKGIEIGHAFYTGPLDGELYIVDKQDMPTLVGGITLHDVVASIPLSFESSDTSIPLGLDLTIDAKDNVRLYNPLLYDMFLQGKVKFEGTVGEPKASGKLSVNKGHVKYLKNRFKITEGQAKFVTGSIIPELNVRSMANVKNYRISLQAEGPATQMKLKLTSEPNLSERQIISLLTFGRNVGNASGVTSEDANALLTSSLQSLAFGYIEDVLQDTLGLDLVNFTTGSLDGKDSRDLQEKNNFNVTIGKYVVPDLMITLTRGLKNDHVSYGFQYDINRSISATGWINNENKHYLGAQWRYRF
ncbi:translocation/assembly module TamB domain-containing protein [Veillonella sp. VA137]|uniref:translocation/assembly module TamB domain-containing protein n=1 Tax=Veillonella sp. VA137 TaxID=741828 RepID=UPI000F8D3EFE|nr:translocation/assembly module TamB domain-containing protein [Veillonella sp. VA137]